MKKKLLTLFILVALLTVFSIPALKSSNSAPLIQNTIFSQIATTASKGGSVELNVQINHAMGLSVAVTLNESYIFVGGANITNTSSGATQPMLWKFNNLGGQEWNTTVNVTGSIYNGGFNKVAISPDNSSVYVVGVNSQHEPILVKFDASNGGSPIWNYTLSGEDFGLFFTVKVSPDSNTVYVAGSNSDISYPSMFYVSAINATNGIVKPGWPYEIFLNGTYDIGLANDLALSPSGDKLYVSGYYSVVNGTSAMKLVALDTSTGSQLWNVTSGAMSKFSAIDISKDGEKIYALEDAPLYPLPFYYPTFPAQYTHLISINTTDGAVIEELPLSYEPYLLSVFLWTSSGSLALSFNESKLDAVANNLPVFLYNYNTLMVEMDFSGTVTGAILAPNSEMIPSGLAPANDNKSVYIVGYQYNLGNGLIPTIDFSMFLLKGSPEPVPLSPFLLVLELSFVSAVSQSLANRLSNPYVLVGFGVAFVAIVAISVIILRKKGK